MEPIKSSGFSAANEHHNTVSRNTNFDSSSRNAKRLSIKVHQPNNIESNHETSRRLSSRPADIPTEISPHNNPRNPSAVANIQSREEDKTTSTPDHRDTPSQTLPADGTQENSGHQHPQQIPDVGSNDSSQNTRDVRQSLPKWKWSGILFANCLLCFTYGYDIGNSVNVQPFVYKSIGSIVYLPWFSVIYSACGISALPLSLMILKYRWDTRILPIVSRMLMTLGSALSGSATSPAFMISGRIFMAFGTSIAYQSMLNAYIVLCAPRWLGLVNGWMASFFAVGITAGPFIGGAFSYSKKATWRWAFFIIIPLSVISVVLQSIFVPNLRKANERLFRVLRTENFDLVGLILHNSTCLTFAAACYLLGAAGEWGAGLGITIWVVFTFVMIAYVIQQTYSIGTTPTDRVLSPFSLMRNKTILKAWVCTVCGAVAYGAALYSVPIFMAFNRGQGPTNPGWQLVLFLATFVITACCCGHMVQAYHYYKGFFLFGSICLIAGGASFQLLDVDTPEMTVHGLEGLIAIGVGSFWQLMTQVCMTFVLDSKDRLHLTLLNSIAQFGGVAASFSMSEMIYQSIGFQSLKESLGNRDAGPSFSDQEILQLLAGVSTPVLESKVSTVILPMVMGATTKAIRGINVITIAAGGLSFIVAAIMKWEAISFKAS